MTLHIQDLATRHVRNAQLGAVSFASCNAILIAASFWISPDDNHTWAAPPAELLMVPQFVIHIVTMLYGYLKGRVQHLLIAPLCISVVLVVVYFAVAIQVLANADKSGHILMGLIEWFNILIAFFLIADTLFSALVAKNMRKDTENSLGDDESRPSVMEDDHDVARARLPAFVYQPQLSIAPSQPPPTLSATMDHELEELPKYSRRRPAQSATIVDMSNMEGMDPSALSPRSSEAQHNPTGAPVYPSPALSSSQSPPEYIP
ncbi:hypothetical protein BG011_000820 [Mortierella polycephala]|uniref:Uncharacterized protein n=1 Tax=Mortierella polycephala TaxID=41804 RepID=A0A9P6Q6C5_9FUNG|nr:hypothetical protein BG011_000820 [Mortierella polycephala]